jgi:hypothetical protein
MVEKIPNLKGLQSKVVYFILYLDLKTIVGCSSENSLSLGVFYTGAFVAKNTLRHPELPDFIILSRPFSMGSDRYPSAVGTFVLAQYSLSSQ